MFTGGKITKFDRGEWTFSVRNYEVFIAMNHLGTLQKTVLPVLQGGVKSVLAGSKGLSANIEDMGDIAELVAEGLNDVIDKVSGDQLEQAIRILLNPEYVAVAKQGSTNYEKLTEDKANEVFEGDFYGMFVVAVKVFQANYANFSFFKSIENGGLTQAFENAKQKFREKLVTSLDGQPSSTEQ